MAKNFLKAINKSVCNRRITKSSKSLKSVGLMLIGRANHQDAGIGGFKENHRILEQKITRAVAGLTLVAVVSLMLLAVVPEPHADDVLTVPDAWRGTWDVTVAYQDRETGALVATDVTTASICSGEPIAPIPFEPILNYSGEANDGVINLSGRAKYSPKPGCNIFVDVSFDSYRDGDAWSGTGSWTANTVGNGAHLNVGEDFVVSGRRVSTAAA